MQLCTLWGAQVRDAHGGERGRAEAAHLLSVPHGALLRAALSEGGVGRPPGSVQADEGAPELGAASSLCAWERLGYVGSCTQPAL